MRPCKKMIIIVWIRCNAHKIPIKNAVSIVAIPSGFEPFTTEKIINYIKGQKEHHKTVSYKDEIKALLEEAGLPYDERYL